MRGRSLHADEQPSIHYFNIQETIMNTTTHPVRFRGLIVTAILGALATGFATIGAAADATDVPQVVVKFGDLSLSSPQGANKLYSRLAAAAQEVCKSFAVDDRDLGARARVNACLHRALADAVTQVGQPELFAIYNAKNGTKQRTALVSQNH
jgi:UrcA family protein